MSNPEYIITSTIERPNGIRVEVTVTVPMSESDTDVLDLAEHTQLAATRTMSATMSKQMPF